MRSLCLLEWTDIPYFWGLATRHVSGEYETLHSFVSPAAARVPKQISPMLTLMCTDDQVTLQREVVGGP